MTVKRGNCFSLLAVRFAFQQALYITLAVQNPDDLNVVIVNQIINPNSFKPWDGPGAKVLKLRVGENISRPN